MFDGKLGGLFIAVQQLSIVWRGCRQQQQSKSDD